MTFEKLLDIANIHIDFPDSTPPLNSYDIATKQLHILVKNSLQCKIDFKTEDNPLTHNEAIYTTFKGDYVIYYDENHPYNNFFIAHEIAHHLLNHLSDDIDKHHDANLLAAIIVAPPHLIKKYKITNSTMLSTQGKIPIEVADIYWKEYEHNYLQKQSDKSFKYITFAVIIAVLSFNLGLFANPNIRENPSKNAVLGQSIIATEITTETIPITTEEIPVTTYNPSFNSEEIVYVTKTGEKYHKPDCQYVKGHDVTSMPLFEAEEMGYEPCKVCWE